MNFSFLYTFWEQQLCFQKKIDIMLTFGILQQKETERGTFFFVKTKN